MPEKKDVDKAIEKQVIEKFIVEKLPKIEKSEIKEKPEKFEHKEKPEKVEHKEKPEKVEHKEFKELEKFIVEKAIEKPQDPGDPIEQRLAALEQTVASLTHFITTGQRPDLSRGALTNEPGAKKAT
jgi:hypothetical protein